MVWPAVIAAGAGLAMSRMGQLGQQSANSANLRIARETNANSAAMADRQMQFQERMFHEATGLENTAHQRQVKDLQAAGLNPMLAAGAAGAGGVSPPSGASAPQTTGAPMQNENSSYAAAAPIVAGLANSAAGYDKTMAETEKVRAETLDAINRAGISSVESTKADALMAAMMAEGIGLQQVADPDRGFGALTKYMQETVSKPEIQAKAAAMAQQSNEEALQKFINMPASNALMQAAQMALKVYLAGKGSDRTTTHILRKEN